MLEQTEEKDMAKSNPMLSELKKACKGLTVVSETDAELEPFLWDHEGELDEETVVEMSGQEEGTAIEETTVDRFFKEISGGEKKKFADLAKVLKDNLSDIRVYKLGEVEKEVFIVGTTRDGKWVGLKTQVVE